MDKKFMYFFAGLACFITSIILFTLKFALDKPYLFEAGVAFCFCILFFGMFGLITALANMSTAQIQLAQSLEEFVINTIKVVQSLGNQPVMGHPHVMRFTKVELKQKLEEMDNDNPFYEILQDAYKKMEEEEAKLPLDKIPLETLQDKLQNAIQTDDFENAKIIQEEIERRKKK